MTRTKLQIDFREPWPVEKTAALMSIVPGYVWTVKEKRILPTTFYPEAKRLDQSKVFSSQMQKTLFERFCRYPNRAQTYIVSSDPDYMHASYFAARLVSIYLKKYGAQAASGIVWHTINKLADQPVLSILQPKFLIISTVYAESSQYRIEQVRDLLDKYWSIPKVLIASGIDPISLASNTLHVPVHSIYYHASSLVVSNKVA